MGLLKNFFKRIVVEALTEVLEPRIRTIVREEMRAAFEQEWGKKIRAIVRDEIRVAMETEWVPRLQAMWRDDINRLSDRFSSRFDAIQNRLDILSDMIVSAVQLMARAREELAEEVRSLRADVERIKAHIGLTGGERT